MPTLTTTIEDTSPVIVYSSSGGYSDWRVGSSKDDPSTELYSQSSYMVTNVTKAQAVFSFYGTGVQIFGSKRRNHGYYQISIDTVIYPPANGVSPDTDSFQTPLFTTVALANAYHNVKMQNLGTGNLDLDFITWQTSVGEVDEPLIASTIQDTDPSFSYSPPTQWGVSPPNIGMFSGGSGHVTTLAGSYAELKFKVSDAIAVYGPVGPNGAAYSVSLNGGIAANYSSSKPFYRPQMVLFQASNLGKGEHTVQLKSESWDNSAMTLGIDYAEVYTTSSLQANNSSARLTTGGIAAVAIGGVFGLFLIAGIILLCCRMRGSGNGKLFGLKGKSQDRDPLVAEAFHYRPVSSYMDSSASNHTLTHEGSLHSRPSQGTLGSGHHFQQGQVQTPPSTSLWPSSGGTGSGAYGHSADQIVQGSNTQVITIPFTPDGKYRPDLLVSAPPALMPPPQGIRRIASEGNTIHRMQSSRSQTDLPSLPRGAGQPIPNVMEADMRIADDDQSGHRHSQGSHHSHRPAAGLQPLRPQPGTPLPPDYQSEEPRSFLAM